jgi:DNA-binding CsgD family transcriptional regulator
MKVIVFSHLRKAGEWMTERINRHSPLSGIAVVTSGSEYLEVARKVRDFGVVVGQYKMLEYEEAERLLSEENIFPYRRVISAPVVTTKFLEWASEQCYDGVVDLIASQNTFGEEVYKALMAPKGRSQSSIGFPLTSSYGGLIPFRDDTDGDIVRLIIAGLNNNEIAERVFLSVQTVRNRISRMLEASGARNRTHLAVMYLIPHTSSVSHEIQPTLSNIDHLDEENSSNKSQKFKNDDGHDCTQQSKIENIVS